MAPVDAGHLRQHDVGAVLLGVGREIAESSLGEHVVGAHHEEVLTGDCCDALVAGIGGPPGVRLVDRKSTRLNSSHVAISYAVFCLKKKTRSHLATLRREH